MSEKHKQLEYRQEAEQLALASKDDQRRYIAMLREIASNAKVPKEDRADAKARANALHRILKISAAKMTGKKSRK